MALGEEDLIVYQARDGSWIAEVPNKLRVIKMKTKEAAVRTAQAVLDVVIREGRGVG